MINQKDQNPKDDEPQSNSGSEQGQAGKNQDSTENGGVNDPVHNTGNEKMRIDEEGAEIMPDDEV